jgi:hypothetical protein
VATDSSALGRELIRELLDVTLEEFRLTESRSESDSRLGRELLYLLSNTGWVRRTTEIVDVSRVAAVETRVVVDVDASYIAHEALRTVHGPLWLPLIALPRPADDPDGEPDAVPDRPVSIDVTDGSGDRVAEVPQAEVGRQLAAALAETLVARLQRRGAAESGQATRDLQVLLAAVLARLLPRPAGADEPAPVDVPTGAAARGNRLQLAQRRLRERLTAEIAAADAEAARAAQPDADLAAVDENARSTLNSREAEIVGALRGCRLVVVPIDPQGPPTSFTVAMPARTLTRTPPGRYGSVARLRIALLVPSTHADRVIEVVVPDGVRTTEPPQARIEVLAPQQFEQLRLLLDRMLRPDNPPHGWVRKQLAELAVVKLHAAIHCLRHHYETGDEAGTERLLATLRGLREPLDAEAHGRAADLGGPWAAARALLPERLLRRIDRSTTDPGSIRFRATAIEEFTLRSEPTEAYVEVVVSAGDSPTLGTARAVNGINVLVLAGVVGLLAAAHRATDNRADILATLLTIFPTLQASRLEQPDSTRLVGLLTMRHFRIGLLTAVPGLALAGVLAFAPEGRRLLVAACVAVALQLACHLWIRWLGDESVSRRRRRPRLTLATVRAADHRAFGVLRAAWCRSLTGDVLLLGRSAYPYVAVDRDEPGALVDLITGAQGELVPDGSTRLLHDLRTPLPRPPVEDGGPPVNLLGLLRGTAVGRSATFLVFRDPPKPGWLAAAAARDAAGHLLREVRPMAADRTRVAPAEPPDWVLDVMIGARDQDTAGFEDHPLVRIARAAQRTNFTLLNVQLPAPPPLQDAAERHWLRLRVGVPYRRGDSLRKLVRFLAALDGLKSAGVLVHLREVPQMESLDATQTAPEDSFDELPGARVPTTGKTSTGRLVTDLDVQVPAGPGDAWRLVAVCAQPRAGLLAETLAALHRHAGVRGLAAAISGVFDGTMVIFLLCRAGVPARPEDEVVAAVEAATRPYRAVVRLLDGVRPAPAPVDPRPLLRVQVRTPDRPGVMQDLLRQLAARLSTVDGEVDVIYALTPVVDGQALSGRLLLRLPHHPLGDEGWAAVDWQDLGRIIAQAVSRTAGVPSAADAERTTRLSDDTAVTLDLVRRPAAASGLVPSP